MKPSGLWIVDYRCGCSKGPSLRRQLLNYCAVHGESARCFYPMSTDAAIEERDKPTETEEKKR